MRVDELHDDDAEQIRIAERLRHGDPRQTAEKILQRLRGR